MPCSPKNQQNLAIKSSRLIDSLPFFYGWVILAAGTTGIVMIGPSQTFTVGVFIDAFIHDLSISRSNISLIYGVATLSASFMLPVTGRLLDRYGARRMVVVVTFVFGLVCMAMGLVQGVISIFLGLFALRFLGFGSLQMVSNNVIAQWFIRRRGVVMGLAGLSLPIGLIIFPILAQSLLDQFGWRGAWVMMGVLVWLIMVPVGGFLFKDRPELYGLQPDGDTDDNSKPSVSNPGWVAEEDWTLAEARHTRAFWIFALALATMSMITAGLIFHQISLFEVRGLSRQNAVDAYRIIAFFSIIGNLSMGRLLDRLSARLLLSVTLLLLVVTLVTVQLMTTPVDAFFYAATIGLVSGCFRVLDAVVWPKYYGRRYLGAIKGATMIGVLGATALGPYPIGASFDYWGSYAPALNTLILFSLVISVVVLFINRPQKSP